MCHPPFVASGTFLMVKFIKSLFLMVFRDLKDKISHNSSIWSMLCFMSWVLAYYSSFSYCQPPTLLQPHRKNPERTLLFRSEVQHLLSLCLEGLLQSPLLLHAWPCRTEWRRLPWLHLPWTGLGTLPAALCAPTALILWSLSLQLSQPYPHSEILSNKNSLFPMVGI